MRNEPTIEANAVARRKEDIFEFEANLLRRPRERRVGMKNHAVFDTAGAQKSKQSHKKERSQKRDPEANIQTDNIRM